MFSASAAKVRVESSLHSHPKLSEALSVKVGNKIARKHAKIGVEPVLAVSDSEDVGGAEIFVNGRGGMDGDIGDRSGGGGSWSCGGGRRLGNAVGTDKGLDCGEMLVEG